MLWLFLGWNIPADNADAFLLKAWQRAWTLADDAQGYMEEVAERAYLAEGHFIRTDNVYNFVDDLKRYRYLNVVYLQ